jgi:anti-sigma factor RsiW
MIQEKLADLIQREIDGELSSEERQTLREILESDSEARRLSDRLHELVRSLSSVAHAEFPADLRGSILRSIAASDVRREVEPEPRPPHRHRTPRWMPLQVRPFAAGLAAGVAVTALVLGISSRLQPDASSVVGTMRSQNEVDAWKAIGRLGLEADRTTGRADVWARDGARLLTLELRALEETEVVVEFDPPTWDLTSFERSRSDGAVQIGRDHLSWKHNGVGTYRLQWQSTKEDVVSLSLRVKLRAGETWHEHVLPMIE